MTGLVIILLFCVGGGLWLAAVALNVMRQPRSPGSHYGRMSARFGVVALLFGMLVLGGGMTLSGTTQAVAVIAESLAMTATAYSVKAAWLGEAGRSRAWGLVLQGVFYLVPTGVVAVKAIAAMAGE